MQQKQHNMIYPKNFENKIGFHDIRKALKGRCLSTLGSEMVDSMKFMTDAQTINRHLTQISEMRLILEEDEGFPDEYFIDMRSSLVRIQLRESYMEETELFALRNSLTTIASIIRLLYEEDSTETRFPALAELSAGINSFPLIIEQIDCILNKFGKIRDDASPELQSIRSTIESTRRSINSSLRSILHNAQEKGYAPQDAAPTLRDGRLVIPIIPSTKRKISGIIHDESATGKTVFLEPTEVVEANNRIRSLEAEEQREIIRILQAITNHIRPQVPAILTSYKFMGLMDFIRAKALYADHIQAIEPHVADHPIIHWQKAIHPLLQEALLRRGKQMNALDISLHDKQRILLISGPNAGGKSICLSTVGLLQYMVQCGLSIPVAESSQVGLFQHLFIDIGDEQSIEDELSTYSGHLYNMKTMMKQCQSESLILIDEMGSGTEPQIGAAIAQAMLHRFMENNTWGIITTHYQNLKDFAQEHDSIVNGAMLYDKEQMRPLFQLQIGMPGSSFAIEIAHKIGLPQEVIREASDIVGSDYIQSDKYLQDIIRDKRYWESKRQNVHQKERRLDELIGRYEKDLADLSNQRKAIISEAKQQAASLLKESNAKIENTIRTIRENQAQKEETKKVRQQLNEFKEDISLSQERKNDAIARRIEQIKQRRLRHEQRQIGKHREDKEVPTSAQQTKPLQEGDYVKITGQQPIGKIEKIKDKQATVTFGNIRMNVQIQRLAPCSPPKEEERPLRSFLSQSTRESITEKSLQFKPEIDVRGMNGDEALRAVTYFIEDAILLGTTPLRILHGTGSGYLRQIIRQYLHTVPTIVSARDEHIQLGGAGITVVELKF